MSIDNLYSIRHSLAHLLAMAVLKINPGAKFGTGPVTDNGFHYDIRPFDDDSQGGSGAISDKDFGKLEKTIRGFITQKLDFIREEISADEARELFKDQPFKLELIDDIVARGEKITVYKTGDFTDLCEGPHVANTSDIPLDAFKIYRLAGAYWKSDENKPQLLRVAGLAFETKDKLDNYIQQQEEAKKRDHKKIGAELDLFTFSDLVGSGLPLWTPKGTILRTLLDNYVWELRTPHGYERVEIPHITKKDLYVTSGHWDKFKDELFRVSTREGHEFVMKPMNCPHHTQIYARKQWSYRELPQRYANTTMCYRDEQSGELSGLSRTRAFAQDDAHVFCRMSQVHEEFLKIWDIVHEFYKTFGFDLRVRISKHDPATPEKYLGNAENWERAETILTDIAREKNATAFEGVGEAAFYGPKLDFMAQDAIGRELQVATIQLDLNMPERFDLFCIDESGNRERIVMIHAAIMGSIDRFLSVLIEHVSGAFPLWLAPEQVWILPIGETHRDYAGNITRQLKDAGIRAHLHAEDESLGKRIRAAKVAKIPYFLVIGDKEVTGNTATLESRDRGDLGAQTIDSIREQLLDEQKSRCHV